MESTIFYLLEFDSWHDHFLAFPQSFEHFDELLSPAAHADRAFFAALTGGRNSDDDLAAFFPHSLDWREQRVGDAFDFDLAGCGHPRAEFADFLFELYHGVYDFDRIIPASHPQHRTDRDNLAREF